MNLNKEFKGSGDIIAYLDNNILVSIEDNELKYEDIKDVYGERVSFVYSYTHIQELLEAKKNFDELKVNRLKTIKDVMNNKYIYPNGNQICIKTENPESVILTIQKNLLVFEMLRKAVNSFNIDRAKFIRILNIDEKRINNYKPIEVIEYINKATSDNLKIEFVKLIDFSGMSSRERINTLFNFLDFVGFWKDKKTEKSNLARMYDASHTFFASSCNMFISNDQRARYKAKVAYSLFNIDTIVLSFKEFLEFKI